jgi:NAD(P)H-hydrate epimerase
VYKLIKIPRREKISHKNSYGRYLVWATSRGVIGCGYFVARAISLCGGGYVKLVIPQENYYPLSILAPECVFFLYSDEQEKEKIVQRELPNHDYLVCGPGIGINENNQKLIRHILKTATCPVIFDADALKILSNLKNELKSSHAKIIITPHEGEFSILAGRSIETIRNNREKVAKEFAAEYKLMCVLKGYRTVVTDGEIVYINKSGGPQLAKAGTGDVLTGTIAGLLGLKIKPFDAATLGVYLHGLASDILKKEIGEHSLIPDTLLSFLPRAIKLYSKRK